MERRVKIVFIIHSLHSGGSERVMLHLLKNLNRQRFAITFIILNKEGALVKYLPDDITILSFHFRRTLSATFRLYKTLYDLKPELVFSTLNQVNLLVSLLIPFLPGNIRFIARESSIASQNNKNDRYPALFRFLYKTSFKRFHSIICQSLSMEEDLIKHFHTDKQKIIVINNPIDFTNFPPLTSTKKQRDIIQLISVGRLRKEKGYDRILNALAQCKTPFNYKIIGDGPMKSELQALVMSLELQDKVEFLGEIALPYTYVADSELFIQGSYYEGFPNAVIEANACGIPVVAWSAPGGHNEIIVQNVNGWIVQTAEELSNLIASKKFLAMDKESIISLVNERYSLHKIIAAYERHFLNLTCRTEIQ